jgi:hypothetical protein
MRSNNIHIHVGTRTNTQVVREASEEAIVVYSVDYFVIQRTLRCKGLCVVE